MSSSRLAIMERYLDELGTAIREGSRRSASHWTRRLELFSKRYCQKSPTALVLELAIALAIAVTVAVVVRQMWFEQYEIPTGSMRPTFREQDHLLVTKTSFGLNIPLQPKHLLFYPENLRRGGVVIWSGENIDLPDTDAMYFGVIPYKKRYIKRLVGFPGDSLYFYGGQIYGVDADGRDLTELRDSPWMQNLEHIPFNNFEGRVVTKASRRGAPFSSMTFKLMGIPFARLEAGDSGELRREVYDGWSWSPEQLPQESQKGRRSHYGDFIGMNNFAMARLLTRQEAERLSTVDVSTVGEGLLYLQLHHHPNLIYPTPRYIQQQDGRVFPVLAPFETLIPLNQEHLARIMKTIYTARFVVSEKKASRYMVGRRSLSSDAIDFPDLADGTYDFYHGKLESVGRFALTTSVSDDNPIYQATAERVQRLFNLGIDFRTIYDPSVYEQAPIPARYAYFRDGDLYLMGSAILNKDDPELTAFLQREKQRQDGSSARRPYVGFLDAGPPRNEDGSIDVEFIRTFGVTVPEKHYVVLGDNHAMSSDSRYFGFVPEGNLEGSPSVVIWPAQERAGVPPQPCYPWITVPRVVVWVVFAICVAIALLIQRRERRKDTP